MQSTGLASAEVPAWAVTRLHGAQHVRPTHTSARPTALSRNTGLQCIWRIADGLSIHQSLKLEGSSAMLGGAQLWWCQDELASLVFGLKRPNAG